MNTTSCFGSIALLLGLSCVTLSIIALVTTRWHHEINGNREYGLFESCLYGTIRQNCLALSIDSDYVRATQAFVIMGAVVSIAPCFALVFVICGRGPAKLNFGIGIIFLIAGIFLLVGSSIYTGVNRPRSLLGELRFGYSLWLSWAATVNAFAVTPVAFLAKRNKINLY